MNTAFGNLLAYLIAAAFVAICLALGIIGLVLPVIPGLLFLAIAAMVAAHYFPFLDRWFRKNRTLAGYLDSGRGFLRLSWKSKLQYVCWLCLKVFVDTIMLVIALLAAFLNFARRGYSGNSRHGAKRY